MRDIKPFNGTDKADDAFLLFWSCSASLVLVAIMIGFDLAPVAWRALKCLF